MSDSVQALKRQLEDPSVSENFSELLSIFTLLANCVIAKQYRVPDSLVRSINLTELGKGTYQQVSEKRRFKPNELKLAIAMAIGSADGLLVDPESDVAGLRAALSAEILARRILFPYVFGRDLHDLAAQKYPEKTFLNNLQTLALLRELPPGVFQEGKTVVGPFGAILSDELRLISARTAVPGYLCSDETCNSLHTIQLRTGDTSIASTREYVNEYISKHHAGTEDGHARVVNESRVKLLDFTTVEPSEALFDTLSDAFTVPELRLVSETLLRNFLREDGSRAHLSKRFGAIVTSPADFVASLDRPSLLQLLLTFKDKAVVGAVDAVIRDGRLPMEEYEIRVETVDRSGAGDSAQVGRLGVRSYERSIVAERIFGLLQRLYYDAGILEPADLEYGLGTSAGTGPVDLLGLAVRRLEPRDLLKDLVLTNRRAAYEAAEYLGVHAPDKLERDELLESMLWKLGAPTEIVFTDLDRMESHEESLLSANERSSEEILRGHISNLFATVEDSLQRALAFSTWAMTADHFLLENGFQYDPLPDAMQLTWLDEMAPTEVGALALKKDGKNTLAPLAAGFGRLAKGLKAMQATDLIRPEDQEPLICRASPRPFVFKTTVPYFDLTAESQTNVLSALHEIAALFSDVIVAKVRNATVHGNNPFPSAAEIRLAVDRVKQGRRLLSGSGLFPQVFAFDGRTMDAFGRERYRYIRGERRVDLNWPVWPVAPRMPLHQPRLVIVDVASFGAVGPMRFSLKARPGKDAYWDDWPKRWKVERHYSGTDRSELSRDGFAESAPG
ncbi:hypothetical protein [Kribbella sp. NPDC000426]|uniref:hypothetical protein n=1 Tax=Kribbella sp. NPDC000426 TaxID=3154255 RepID=UPI003320F2A7